MFSAYNFCVRPLSALIEIDSGICHIECRIKIDCFAKYNEKQLTSINLTELCFKLYTNLIITVSQFCINTGY